MEWINPKEELPAEGEIVLIKQNKEILNNIFEHVVTKYSDGYFLVINVLKDSGVCDGSELPFVAFKKYVVSWARIPK